MATKNAILNAVMFEIGNRSTTDTGEPVEAARVFNTVYDNVVAECLKDGGWNFATETVKLDADTGVDPNFGYEEVFAKPSDWIRTVAVSQDENFVAPLTDYYDDANIWSAHYTPIYVRYVSNDTGMGLELTRWPADFRRYVELEIASRICYRLTSNSSLQERIDKKRDRARLKALSQDAMNESQPKFPPQGNWSASRGGRTAGRRDRGSRGSLTG